MTYEKIKKTQWKLAKLSKVENMIFEKLERL